MKQEVSRHKRSIVVSAPQHIGSTRRRMVASPQQAKRRRTMHSGRPLSEVMLHFLNYPARRPGSLLYQTSFPYPACPCRSLSVSLLVCFFSPHPLIPASLASLYFTVLIRLPFIPPPLPYLSLSFPAMYRLVSLFHLFYTGLPYMTLPRFSLCFNYWSLSYLYFFSKSTYIY